MLQVTGLIVLISFYLSLSFTHTHAHTHTKLRSHWFITSQSSVTFINTIIIFMSHSQKLPCAGKLDKCFEGNDMWVGVTEEIVMDCDCLMKCITQSLVVDLCTEYHSQRASSSCHTQDNRVAVNSLIRGVNLIIFGIG